MTLSNRVASAHRKAFDRLRTAWQTVAILSIATIEGGVMPKEEWGVKRVCPDTGRRFYDLGRNPIVSPYTDKVLVPDPAKGGRSLIADKPERVEEEEEETIVEDDDGEAKVEDGDDPDDDDGGAKIEDGGVANVHDDDDDDDGEAKIEDDGVLDDDDDTVALSDVANVAADSDDDD